MRRWRSLAMLSCRGSTQTARVSPGFHQLNRHNSTTAGSMGKQSGQVPMRHSNHRRPEFGRFSNSRSYHSRWSISVYGKEPGAPKEEYEGYEGEMHEYKQKGVAFEDTMVNDDGNEVVVGVKKTNGIDGNAINETNEDDDSSLDHLGNIEKKWDEEDDDEGVTEGVIDEDDPLEEWAGGDLDLQSAAKSAKNESIDSDPQLDPGLYLVGTPIGNLEDITLRALRILRSADAVLCEDTRHTRRLLQRYNIDQRLVSYHAHNQRQKRDGLVDKIRSGFSLALVSDAGTPAVADPGADLASACVEEGLAVVPIPGPCAPASAIVASGNLTPNEESFTFIGFLPPKTGQRRKRFAKFSNAPGSLVAFVPPHKLVATLEDAAVALGDRGCVVCREMTKAVIIPLSKLLLPIYSDRRFDTRTVTTKITTKVHEEFWRGTLSGAVAEFSERKPRGEITLVVQGVGPNGGFGGVGTSETIANTFGTSAEDMEELMESFLKKMILDEGVSPSDAAKRVSKELGVRKKEAYVLALRLAGKQ